jgi:hypothetical protein
VLVGVGGPQRLRRDRAEHGLHHRQPTFAHRASEMIGAGRPSEGY